MPDPLLAEPFLRRPAPRCLTQPGRAYGGEAAHRLPLRRATWPLRAAFEGWALRLLRARSGGTA